MCFPAGLDLSQVSNRLRSAGEKQDDAQDFLRSRGYATPGEGMTAHEQESATPVVQHKPLVRRGAPARSQAAQASNAELVLV